MAELVLTDASVVINSVDLSDHVGSVTISYSAAIQDKSAMGDTFVTRLAGLKDWSASVEFNQDYAASNVDATIFPIVGTSVTCVFKPTSGAVSATNPSFTGAAFVESYDPISGSVGDVQKAPISLTGNGVLTRAEA